MTAGFRIRAAFRPRLTRQIGEAEHRLQVRRRLVGARGAALDRRFRQWMTDPSVLLWAGGMGFFIGELTQRHAPKPQGPEPLPNASFPILEAARHIITLVALARPLFSALPGARTRRPNAAGPSDQTPAPPARSPGAPAKTRTNSAQ